MFFRKLSLIDIYRLVLFLFSFITIIVNFSDFYTAIKYNFGSICLIFLLTYKKIWIKKKRNLIVYYFNFIIIFLLNFIFVYFLIINIFLKGEQ